MTHTPEFHSQSVRDVDKSGRELAAAYARVFLGDDDGKRVLADLRSKFGVQRLVFQQNGGKHYDYLAAALVDGERRVLSEIEGALSIGAPGQGVSEKTQ